MPDLASRSHDRDLISEKFPRQGLAAESPRARFRLLFDIALKSDGEALDQAAFRRLLFFGESGKRAVYKPCPDLGDTDSRWGLYQGSRVLYLRAECALVLPVRMWARESRGHWPDSTFPILVSNGQSAP